MVQLEETAKTNYLINVIAEAHLIDESVVIIDDVEIIMGYVRIMQTLNFSNRIYQTILSLLKHKPENTRNKCTIILVISDEAILEFFQSHADHLLRIGSISKEKLISVCKLMNIDSELYKDKDSTIKDLVVANDFS